MIHRFLKKFSAKPETKALKSILEGTQKIRTAKASDARSGTIEVPTGQTCVVNDSEGEIHIFPSGTHDLASRNINPESALRYLYLIDGAHCDGNWSLKYLDHEQISVALSGSYTVKLDKPLALARSCFKTENFRDERDFSDWIAKSIITILKTQRIPAHDIHSENERFANFLSNVLTGALRHKGLVLQAISMNINTTPASAEPEKESDGSQSKATHTPTDDKNEKQNTVEQVIAHHEPRPEKLFYYVRNGQQYGPFSHDEIRDKLTDGELKKRDLLWQKGMTTWKAIADFQEFQ